MATTLGAMRYLFFLLCYATGVSFVCFSICYKESRLKGLWNRIHYYIYDFACGQQCLLISYGVAKQHFSHQFRVVVCALVGKSSPSN